MKPYIGIKRIWYGNPFSQNAFSLENLQTWLNAATEVKNSHQDTWSYEQDDPDVTDYINELSGKPYYRDITSQGNKTISFTLGEYAFGDKCALQGGAMIDKDGNTTAVATNAVGWSAPSAPALIYKAIVGLTKTGNLIVFTNAGVTAKVDTQEKNLGLGIQAVAMSNDTKGIEDEYWLDGEKFTFAENDGTITLTAKNVG